MNYRRADDPAVVVHTGLVAVIVQVSDTVTAFHRGYDIIDHLNVAQKLIRVARNDYLKLHRPKPQHKPLTLNKKDTPL